MPPEDTNIIIEGEISEATTPPTPPESPKIEEVASSSIQTPPTEPVVTPALPQPTVVVEEPEIRTARTDETGDKVYAIRHNKRYWVKNPETLKKMGFYLGQEKKIPFSELLQNVEGDPIDLTVPDAQYPWDKPEVVKTTEPLQSHQIWN